MVPVLTVEELKARLDAGEAITLLDVREPDELEISRLEGVVEVPLGQLPDRIGELDPNATTVVVCRSGARSERATAFLLAHGFRSVTNLAGGMNAWAQRVDPSLPVY